MAFTATFWQDGIAGGTPLTAANLSAREAALGAYTDTTVSSAQSTLQSSITTVQTTIVRNRQTGTTYTLVLTDAGKSVEMNNAGANTLTVPPNSSVAFPIETVVVVGQYGAGKTTVAAGAGVTIRAAGGALGLRVQYSTVTLHKIATDEWWLSGDTG